MSGCDRDGKPRFIEVNPLAGIRPGYSDLCFIADFQKISYQATDRQIPGFLSGAVILLLVLKHFGR